MVVLSTLLSLLLKVGVVDDVDVEVAVLSTFFSSVGVVEVAELKCCVMLLL